LGLRASSEGFNNNGETLFLATILMERYRCAPAAA
jgi:hypothetical protein